MLVAAARPRKRLAIQGPVLTQVSATPVVSLTAHAVIETLLLLNFPVIRQRKAESSSAARAACHVAPGCIVTGPEVGPFPALSTKVGVASIGFVHPY